MRSVLCALLLAACAAPTAATAEEEVVQAPPLAEGQEEAVFAGGCFWCMESDFEKLPGVLEVVSGYTGGAEKPSYYAVGSGKTGHIESVRIVFDPTKTSWETLLGEFWHHVDPTQANGQFCDLGPQYRTAIFVSGDEQRALAEKTKLETAAALDQPVVTEILDQTTFWVAEAHHQDFYKTNPAHYKRYRMGCGRDRRLKQLWGDEAGH